jgi:Ferritin-like domain
MQDFDQDRLDAVLERRKFLKATSLAGLSVAGVAFLGGAAMAAVPSRAQGPGSPGSPVSLSATDVAILNFALNLEYLEAEFYTYATTGKTLDQSGFAINGTGEQGSTTGGTETNFGVNAFTFKVAQQITSDEQHHVVLLRTLLGSQAIAKPEINLAALGPFSTVAEFLALGRAFEDVGVSAYGGAAPLIQSKSVLAVAARIAQMEAEHVAGLRVLVAQEGVPTSKVDAQDVLPPPSGTYIFSRVNGLTIIRNTSEVLAIVYANTTAGAHQGGFFPDGVNGSINTVA